MLLTTPYIVEFISEVSIADHINLLLIRLKLRLLWFYGKVGSSLENLIKFRTSRTVFSSNSYVHFRVLKLSQLTQTFCPVHSPHCGHQIHLKNKFPRITMTCFSGTGCTGPKQRTRIIKHSNFPLRGSYSPSQPSLIGELWECDGYSSFGRNFGVRVDSDFFFFKWSKLAGKKITKKWLLHGKVDWTEE